MTEEILVHKSYIEHNGDSYQVLVYCRTDGRHFAKTHFGDDDIIINDGASLEEALARHNKLLPLAISSRKVMQEFRGFPNKGK
jgi:hypothetical protein